MGSRRIGRARLSALSELGTSLTGSALASAGISGSVGAQRIVRSGQQVITEYTICLASSLGALSQAGEANTIIGHSASHPVDNASLGQVEAQTHGIVHTVHYTCVEAPLGGDADIDLVFGTANDAGYSGSATGQTAVCQAGGALVVGQMIEKEYDANELNNNFLYLAYGGATDSAARAEYTAGKLIVRLYGEAIPDDL